MHKTLKNGKYRFRLQKGVKIVQPWALDQIRSIFCKITFDLGVVKRRVTRHLKAQKAFFPKP